MKKKRIGVLTGGGDCPGLNAVIRGVVKASIHRAGAELVGILDGFDGLIKRRIMPLTWDNASGILVQGGTILGTTNKVDPFHYAEPDEKGRMTKRDVSDRLVSYFNELKLDILVCIGGDGTMAISSKLMQKGMPIVGVPKTIDNDIWGTDITFGFNSAMTTAAEAIDKLHTTAMSHHRIMVVEVMGRYAGWLALESGLAGGGDVILLPEIPYDLDKIRALVGERSKKGRQFSIVVVSEGAKPLGGEMVVQRMVKESFDPVRLGGIGQKLASDLESATKMESRVTVLGHLQRGGVPTPFDRVLATRFGVKAAEICLSEEAGVMVALKGNDIVSVPLQEVGGKMRLVDPGHSLIRTARDLGICLGD
ncbi:ATP-dependent 6-phosphofructokinase [bacterium]|nr:ATP-dependent 6-phosphofructokinase [bacterium]